MGFETDVVGLINATTGQPTAAYTYDPFGQLLSATGPAAAANPIRFSTRYEDPETSLLYYGYRFLHPATGRWLNRDPLGEAGGVNLYGFVGNNPSNAIDRLGLDWWIFHQDFGVIDAILAGGGGALDGLQNVGNAVIDTYKGAWGLGETIGDYGGAIKDGDSQFLKTKYDLAVFWAEFYGRIAKAAIEDECYRKQLWEQLSPGLKQQFGTADGLSKFFANLGIGAAFSAAGAQAKKGGLFSILDELADMARLKKLPDLPNSADSGLRQVSTGGLRNETTLTAAQIDEAKDYARSLGATDKMFSVGDSINTAYGPMFGEEILQIGTDVLPAISRGQSLAANSMITMRGAIAHELVGHRAAALTGNTNPVKWMEEMQASLRAAKFAPGLSNRERMLLWRDAMDRMPAGTSFSDVRGSIWLSP